MRIKEIAEMVYLEEDEVRSVLQKLVEKAEFMYLRVRNQFQTNPQILSQLQQIHVKKSGKGKDKLYSTARGRLMSEYKETSNQGNFQLEMMKVRKQSFDTTDETETRKRSFSNAPANSNYEQT